MNKPDINVAPPAQNKQNETPKKAETTSEVSVAKYQISYDSHYRRHQLFDLDTSELLGTGTFTELRNGLIDMLQGQEAAYFDAEGRKLVS